MGLFKESMQELFTMSSSYNHNRKIIIAQKAKEEDEDEEKEETNHKIDSDYSNYEYGLNSDEAYVLNQNLEEFCYLNDMSKEKVAFFISSNLIEKDEVLEDKDEDEENEVVEENLLNEQEQVLNSLSISYLSQQDMKDDPKLEVSAENIKKIKEIISIYKYSFKLILVVKNEYDEIYTFLNENKLLGGVLVIKYEEILKEYKFKPYVSSSIMLKKILYKVTVSFLIGIVSSSFLLINLSKEMVPLINKKQQLVSKKNKEVNKTNKLSSKIKSLNDSTVFNVKLKELKIKENQKIKRKY
ncbi:hypothetical protein HOK00_01215 [bacterium]|jgi:hypothetical protein|nr:hypothetical protein [bacterium]